MEIVSAKLEKPGNISARVRPNPEDGAANTGDDMETDQNVG
jgi:hypothetical protein